MKISEKQLTKLMILVPQLLNEINSIYSEGIFKNGSDKIFEVINEIAHQQSNELREIE